VKGNLEGFPLILVGNKCDEESGANKSKHCYLYYQLFYGLQVKGNLEGFPLILVGNKCDEESGARQVSTKTGEALQVIQVLGSIPFK
jgi:hypothetical protein